MSHLLSYLRSHQEKTHTSQHLIWDTKCQKSVRHACGPFPPEKNGKNNKSARTHPAYRQIWDTLVRCLHVWCLCQHVAEQQSGTIMPIFIFGRDRAKLFFWHPKCQAFFLAANHFWQLARGNSWHSYWVQFFLAVKSVFGRIPPNIKVGMISAKNKSWQTQSFFLLFPCAHCYHNVWPHTPRTQQKYTPKAPPISPHIQHITHTTPCGAGGARDKRQRQHAAVAVARPAAAAREVKEGLTPAAREETEAS